MQFNLPSKLQTLPHTFPIEGAIRLELEEGLPLFRASSLIQSRIEELLSKQQSSPLTVEEDEELDLYEAIDDYLSLVNRTVRN
ncbi:MAG: hypothetical protein MUF49_25785 [Oculatellaceae cyanobacterium Prado106]|jgi:hypothetical protein|nr:hypothetical protein [Oculatellaceae cyanobacterium Prado106]